MRVLGLVLFVCVVFGFTTTLSAQSTEFTYQGKLRAGGVDANGPYDLRFRLFDAEAGGIEVSGIPWDMDNVPVTAGIFKAVIDFGPSYPLTETRWLQIEIREGASTGPYMLLDPRQKITATPYAVTASTAQTAQQAEVANDANTVGGFGPKQLIKEGDLRLTDARQPLAGSPSYVQIGPAGPQSGGFDVVGNGKIGSSLTVFGAAFLNSNLSVGGTISGTLADNIVSTTKIADGAVTASKLAPSAVPLNTNLSLLGSLRWDLLAPKTFPVGTGAQALAFDGAHMWITCCNDSVAKIRVSDGANLGTFQVGAGAHRMAFDGENIWITHSLASGTLTKLRVSDGAIAGTFNVGASPKGLAFDGSNIWIANSGGNTVTRLRASDGACVGTCTFTVSNTPSAIAFDGTSIYVLGTTGFMTKLRVSDGAVIGTFSGQGEDIAFDGANLWIVNPSLGTVSKHFTATGSLVGYDLGSTGFSRTVFDGKFIWLSNPGASNLVRVRAADANFSTVYPGSVLAGGSAFAGGIAFDGVNLWMTRPSTGTVNRYSIFP